MLPTINERRGRHDAPYASHQPPSTAMDKDRDGDDRDRRDWRYAPRPDFAYEETGGGGGAPPSTAPLPPLRSTLSYRDDDAWNQRLPPPPPQPHQSQSQSHARPRLDLFAHLPLSSSSASLRGGGGGGAPRVQLLDNDGAMDDDDDDRYHAAQSYHSQHHQDAISRHSHGHYDPSFRSSSGSSNGAAGDPTLSAAASAAAKRRSRRMSNSERGKLYRSRRKEYVETLEDQVEALKQQLEEMRVKGTSSTTTGSNDRPPSPYDTLALSRDRSRVGLVRIVCEYFSLFEHGVPVSTSNASPLPIGSPTQPFQVPQSPRLLSFIQTLMDPNMRFGDNFGVKMLLEQWQRYSAYHAALQLDLNSIEVVAHETSPLVCATATLRVQFSRMTIEKVFPHVLWNEALVQRLIGLDVEYPVINKFYFGPDGKIKRYETEVDFVTAFVKALGNVRDAMQVVGNALIKEQHLIGAEGDDDRDTARAYGGGGGSGVGGRSPSGSQGSASSSVHSQSMSPQLVSSEPLLRPRFQQSDMRPTDEGMEDYGMQATANRFARLGQVHYSENDTPRPPYHHGSYTENDRDYHHHHPRQQQQHHHHHHHDYHDSRQPMVRDQYDVPMGGSDKATTTNPTNAERRRNEY